MKVQQDLVEEQDESPEPLYEEVGDFGLQVLKSLENSFLSGDRPESLPVPPRSKSLGLSKSRSLECTIIPELPNPHSGEDSLETVSQDKNPSVSWEHKSCSSSQEMLLHELSTIFRKPEDDEQPSSENSM